MTDFIADLEDDNADLEVDAALVSAVDGDEAASTGRPTKRRKRASGRATFFSSLTPDERQHITAVDGLAIPADPDSISKEAMAALRAAARRIRNRSSAAASRQRRAMAVEGHEAAVAAALAEQRALKTELDALELGIAEHTHQLLAAGRADLVHSAQHADDARPFTLP